MHNLSFGLSECQLHFDMLCFRLANTQIVQLPDPNKPYLLFTDASKFCFPDVLTQASTADCSETLLKILTSEAPLQALIHKHRTFNLNPVSFIL